MHAVFSIECVRDQTNRKAMIYAIDVNDKRGLVVTSRAALEAGAMAKGGAGQHRDRGKKPQ